MGKRVIFVVVAASLIAAAAGCHKKRLVPTTGDGIPVDVNTADVNALDANAADANAF